MAEDDDIAGASPIRRQWRGGASPTKRAHIADGRYRPARRLAAVLADLCREIGQPLADMPLSRQAVVGDAASLIVQAEALHAAQGRGEAIDGDSLVRISGAKTRALEALGLIGDGAERRRQAEEAAAIEAERRRMGINTRRPGE